MDHGEHLVSFNYSILKVLPLSTLCELLCGTHLEISLNVQLNHFNHSHATSVDSTVIKPSSPPNLFPPEHFSQQL